MGSLRARSQQESPEEGLCGPGGSRRRGRHETRKGASECKASGAPGIDKGSAGGGRLSTALSEDGSSVAIGGRTHIIVRQESARGGGRTVSSTDNTSKTTPSAPKTISSSSEGNSL